MSLSRKTVSSGTYSKFSSRACSGFGVRVRVVRQHAHPEAAEQPDERASDLARADHADRLAAQVEPHEPADGEVPFAHPVVRPVDLPVQRHEQRERVLGHGVRRILRDAHDRDAVLAGRFQVHVVVSYNKFGCFLDFITFDLQ